MLNDKSESHGNFVASNCQFSLARSDAKFRVFSLGRKDAKGAIRQGFRERLDWLKTTEWWSEDEIEAYQNDQIRRLVQHAYVTVPAYRDRMNAASLKPKDITTNHDLRKLPIITKRDVKQDPGAFLSSRYSAKQLHRNLTSGTTGAPLAVFLTKEALQFQWAVWWRHRARFGLELGDRFRCSGRVSPYSPSDHPPYWRTNHAINQVYLSTYHLTPETMPIVLDWLNTQRFRFFTGYPSAMYVLARYMRDSGVVLQHPPDKDRFRLRRAYSSVPEPDC